MMTEQGFGPILDECDFTYGRIDEPPKRKDGKVSVFLEDGPDKTVARDYDAVGLDEHGGECVVMCFNWRTMSTEKMLEMTKGEDLTEAQKEEIDELGGQTLLSLESLIPFSNVAHISDDTIARISDQNP